MDMNKGYEANSIKPKQPTEEEIPLTDYGLETYMELLGFNIEEMKGKLVLDIGTGEENNFAKQAKEKGVEVVPMSPDPKVKDDVPNFTRADVRDMPFNDNHFDFAVARYSVPKYLPKDNLEHEKAFNEIIRVLKKGGTAYLAPSWGEQHKVDARYLESLQMKQVIDLKIQKLENGTHENYRLIITKK